MLFVPLCLAAETVSPEVAKKIAGGLLRANGCLSQQVRQVVEPQFMTKASLMGDPYYIFEGDRGGFVILAADDRLSPVIGWSCDNSFPEECEPANLRAWMDMWDNIVDAMRSGRLEPQKGASAEWEDYKNGKYLCFGTGKMLETAKWNQGSPYNMYCPSVGGMLSVTGCVATATAILMRYHQWPEAGEGELPSYDYTDDDGNTQSVSGLTLGNVYDWENMPLTVDDNTPEESKKQIARLMADLGIMLQSYYNPGGTGAYSSDIPVGLMEYFFYDKSCMYYWKEYYTDAEWTQMICDNIDNVGPVIFSASSKEGGHAFILDGYSAAGQISINWGWGGNGNGMYTYPAFDDFTDNHAMVTGLKKDEGGSYKEILVIDGNGKANGFTSETTEFEVGVPFNTEIKTVFNMGLNTFTGYIALGVMHRDGSLGEIVDGYIEEDDLVTINPWYGKSFSTVETVITEPIRIGDRLCVWYRSDNTPEWTPMPGNQEDGETKSYIQIADPQSIEEVTSFRYTSSSGELVISTKPDAQWSITDADGNEYTDGITFDDGVLTIMTKTFPLQSYFITLSKKDDVKTVEFVYGLEE